MNDKTTFNPTWTYDRWYDTSSSTFSTYSEIYTSGGPGPLPGKIPGYGRPRKSKKDPPEEKSNEHQRGT